MKKSAVIQTDEELRGDVLEIFSDAQNIAGVGVGRCPRCGGPWQGSECLECGQRLPEGV